MSALGWFPEQVPPWGAFTATGQRGILGRPRLHPLAILVRETAQNSWDARLPRGQVHFSIDGFEFTDHQLKTLRSRIFADTPPQGLPLHARLQAGGMRALIVRDSNTHGLGGPTRADKALEGESNRYVRFLLDIGVADRAEVEGGTYGFGRSIAYNVSSVQTVVVYTRTRDQLNSPESRLVASALGEPYSHRGRRHTGRHWWGRIVRNSVEPLVGPRADKLAAEIGISPFDGSETGTAVMILDPILRTAEPDRAMAFIAESITWHLWPKMVPINGRRPMRFSVTWNGTNVRIPEPARMQPLPGYVRALEVLRDTREEGVTADGVEVIEIRAERPKTTLGWLAVSRFPFRNRRPSVILLEDEDDASGASAAPFEANSSHVVLLRRPELVVAYNTYAALPDSNLEWAGVFVAAEQHNEAFAQAEPPTHDSWEPGTVEDKSHRRIVNIALREIRKSVNSRYQAMVTPDGTDGGRSVARVANALGTLFSGVPGGGADVTLTGHQPPRNGASRRRPTVDIERSGPLVEDGQRVSEVVFCVTPPTGVPRTKLRVGVDVATGDGNTVEGDERPIGAPTPKLLRVEGPTDVGDVTGQDEIAFDIEEDVETNWRVVATAPEDVLVAFTIDAEANIS
jgi:hypothetical protein